MGLDMYLYEDIGYESTNDFFNNNDESELVYWRKANAIHRYFCSVGQELEQDVLYKITREDLLNLLNTIKKILGTEESKQVDTAKKLLPTQSGFFFGDTKYDFIYFDMLKNSESLLENLLNNIEVENFIYYASW